MPTSILAIMILTLGISFYMVLDLIRLFEFLKMELLAIAITCFYFDLPYYGFTYFTQLLENYF
ncbi:hypothetical protein ACFL35_07795 [Candidatus Riflebacteria bacterium]